MTRFFILAAVLLLAGAAQETAAGQGLVAIPVSEKKAAPSKGEHIYLKLPSITATIFRRQLPAGTFTVAVTLEIASENSRTDIVGRRRQLRDAMFRELHAMFEREEYTGRRVNVDAVKQRMLVVSRRQLGEGVVVDVFVNTLMRKGA